MRRYVIKNYVKHILLDVVIPNIRSLNGVVYAFGNEQYKTLFTESYDDNDLIKTIRTCSHPSCSKQMEQYRNNKINLRGLYNYGKI